jgi:hypothetical protein
MKGNKGIWNSIQIFILLFETKGAGKSVPWAKCINELLLFKVVASWLSGTEGLLNAESRESSDPVLLFNILILFITVFFLKLYFNNSGQKNYNQPQRSPCRYPDLDQIFSQRSDQVPPLML